MHIFAFLNSAQQARAREHDRIRKKLNLFTWLQIVILTFYNLTYA
jgi:hypothetical protein